MIEGELRAGLFITLAYTFTVIYAAFSLDPFWIDIVRYATAGIFVLSMALWLMPPDEIMKMDGHGLLKAIRIIMFFVQVGFLVWTGLVITVAIRVVAELNVWYRRTAAIDEMHRIMSFEIGRDNGGNTYIYCFECRRRSFNKNDIEHRYCAHCNKTHGVPTA